MASNISDILGIAVEIELTKARSEYETWKKELESNPIKASVIADMVSGHGKPSRSFGGQEMVGGDASASLGSAMPQRTAMPSTAQKLADYGLYVGGSNFGPAARPVPTAGLNTVYGQISGSIPIMPTVNAGQALRTAQDVVLSRAQVQHTDREYGAYRVRAVRSGIMDPMSRADFDREGGYQTALGEIDHWNEQRARNRFERPERRPEEPSSSRSGGSGSAANRQPGQPFLPNLRGYVTAYAALQGVGGVFTSQNQLAYAQIGAMGDRAAYAQATIDNNPLANAIGSVPLLGGIAVGAADYFSGGRIDATRMLAQTRIQDGITSAMRQRADYNRTAGLNAQYAGAGAIGGFSAQMAGYQVALAQIEPNRQLRLAALRQPLDADLAAKEQDFARKSSGINGITAYESSDAFIARRKAEGKSYDMDSYRYNRKSFRVDEMNRGEDQQINTAGLSLDASSQARINEYNQSQVALNQSRSRANSLDPETQKVAKLEEEAIKTQMAIAKAFDKIAATSIAASGKASSAAFNLSASGNSAAGSLAGVAAAFDPQIAAQRERIQAIKDAGGTVSATDEATLADLTRQRGLAMQQTATGIMQQKTMEFGSLKAGAMGLAYKPFDAQRAEAEAVFNAKTARVNPDGTIGTMDANSPAFQQASEERRLRLAQIDQDQKFQTRALDTTLGSQFRGLILAGQRNFIGQEAENFAGGTINQMRDLSRAGFADQAEQLRVNSIMDLSVKSQEYALSFRGEQFDAQNILPFNPRDSQNPEEVFQSIYDAQEKIGRADASPDKDQKSADIITGNVDKLIEQLPAIIKAAMTDLLAN